MSFSLTTTAALAAPLVLWAVAAVPDTWTQRFGPRMAVLTNALAWSAFGLALIALVLHGFGSL